MICLKRLFWAKPVYFFMIGTYEVPTPTGTSALSTVTNKALSLLTVLIRKAT